MPNEIYHRSNWGNPKAEGFGDVYFDAAATNKLYNHSDYYENSDGTDKILRGIPNKASITLTPTAYSDGSINTVIPPYQVLPQELVTNGTFDTDSEWTKGTGWSIENGVASKIQSASASYLEQTLTIAIVQNKIYKITYTATIPDGNLRPELTGGGGTSEGASQTTSGTYTDYVKAQNNHIKFRFRGNADFIGSIDNVSVKEIQEADFDFSRGSSATRVNEQGLVESVASNLPRIDFTDGTGSLLLEPQSTNLVDYSLPNNTNWSKGSNTTITENYAVSPDGTQNASRLVMPTGSGTYAYYQFTATSTTDHTLSFYAKNNGGDADVVMAFFVETQTQNITLTNEWQRFEFTTSITSGNTVQVGVDNITSVDMLIFGVQCEALPYATSYIPTSGSTVTRSADVANNSGNADLFNDSEGVLYAEIAALADDLTFRSISISSDAGYNNSIMIRYISTSNTVNVITRIGSAKNNTSVTVNDITEFNKIAFKYRSEDCDLFINGVKVASSAQAFSSSGINNLSFDRGGGAADFYGKVKAVAVFKEALTDAELENLTSWVSFTQMATDLEYTLE